MGSHNTEPLQDSAVVHTVHTPPTMYARTQDEVDIMLPTTLLTVWASSDQYVAPNSSHRLGHISVITIFNEKKKYSQIQKGG